MTPRRRLVLVLVALGIPGGWLLLGTGPEAAPPAAETALQVRSVQPPGLPPQLLVLTARDPRSPQPRHSNLWRVDPDGAAPPVRLSPHSSYNFWAMCAGDVTGESGSSR